MLSGEQLANIGSISKEEFAKLSRENKELILKILSEYRDTNSSQTLRDLWLVDYNEIPVTIDEFIENEEYLGKSTRKGTSIYPYWREVYRKVFDPSINYHEVVLTGAIGVGKTRTAVICLCYLLYKLMCLKNPQEYFRFNEGDKITIFFLNITLKLAEGVGFNTMHEYLLESPWFLKHGTVVGREKLRYKPPRNITIDFGSKGVHALGQQIFAASMDEVDFKAGGIKGQSALDTSNAIMDAYKTIKTRIVSRFTKNDVLYGRLFLVSSKKSEHDFLEEYVAKFRDDKMLVIDEPQWVIKPAGTYSSTTFPVAVGNRTLRSRMLPVETTDEELEALVKQGYRIIKVPINFTKDFKMDVNQALMDIAGISMQGTVSFFNYDMFSRCYISEYKNPFQTEILTIGLHDDLQIKDFFMPELVPTEVRSMPQYIHIDGSLTGDKTGISSVGASGLKTTKIYNGAEEVESSEMTYKHIFSVDIQAPQGTEISFEKTRQFIYYLRSIGFNIQGISLDGYQSADMKQMLITQGYDAVILSLDKSPDGYLALRSAMNDGRIGLIHIDLLERELIQLQRDLKTGKIDHPADGCFTGDTEVIVVNRKTTEQTTMKIVDLMHCYNDYMVMTINETTGAIEPDDIANVFQTKDSGVVLTATFECESGDESACVSSVTSTPDHRYMLESGEFAEIETIPLGTIVKTIDGNTVRLIRKDIVYLELIGESEPVYDITVKHNHNFALYNGVVVHNSKDMSDSLAGALFNATIHKQDLIDTMQLFEASYSVNTDIDPYEQTISDLSQSLLMNGRQNNSSQSGSSLAAMKIEELLNGYGNDGIIAW